MKAVPAKTKNRLTASSPYLLLNRMMFPPTLVYDGLVSSRNRSIPIRIMLIVRLTLNGDTTIIDEASEEDREEDIVDNPITSR